MSRPNEDDAGTPAARSGYEPPPSRRRGYQRQGIAETVAKSFLRSIAASLGRAVIRMILGRR